MIVYWRINWRLNAMLKVLIAVFTAHFVLSLGEPEPFWQLIRLPAYRSLFIPNLLMSIFIILSVWGVHILFYYWQVKYWGFTFLFGMLLPLLVAIAMAEGYFSIHDISFGDVNYWDLLFPLTVVFVTLLNLYEFFWLFAYKKQKLLPAQKPLSIIVQDGQFNADVPVELCGYFYRSDRIVKMYDLYGKVYFPLNNIEQLVRSLPPSTFTQINRSTIVNRQIIRQVRPGSSRTFALELDEVFGVELKVSQRFRKQFKHWYGSG